MVIAIGSGACLLACLATYVLFGARMAARQKTWLPASTTLVSDVDDGVDPGIATGDTTARA